LTTGKVGGSRGGQVEEEGKREIEQAPVTVVSFVSNVENKSTVS